MNSEKVVAQLRTEFPGKTILQLPPENPTEIICEVDPTADHPGESVAVAVIDRSDPHRHRISTEIYEAVDGEVTLFTDGKANVLKPGQSYVIQPGIVHWVKANGARIRVTSHPGWTPEDHILIPGEKE